MIGYRYVLVPNGLMLKPSEGKLLAVVEIDGPTPPPPPVPSLGDRGLPRR